MKGKVTHMNSVKVKVLKCLICVIKYVIYTAAPNLHCHFAALLHAVFTLYMCRNV